jgi:hypothetical protein
VFLPSLHAFSGNGPDIRDGIDLAPLGSDHLAGARRREDCELESSRALQDDEDQPIPELMSFAEFRAFATTHPLDRSMNTGSTCTPSCSVTAGHISPDPGRGSAFWLMIGSTKT